MKRERIEWCDAWIPAADENCPRGVLLIGDSIARSYYGHVRRRLGENRPCARLATSRSVCDPWFTEEMDLVLREYRYEVIHFNNGLHGWAYSEEDYGRGLGAALRHVRSVSAGALLIVANTTPVRRPDKMEMLDGITERVRARNRLAQEVAADLRLPVNDLFGVLEGRPDLFRSDGVHLNTRGQRLLGGKVADAVLHGAGDTGAQALGASECRCRGAWDQVAGGSYA